jgi:hypothetical protein
MDAIEFVKRYPAYLAQLSKVVKPELHHIIRKLQKIDPHDVVKPEHYFNSEAEALGVVFRLFLRKLKMDVPQKQSKEEKREQVNRQIKAAKKMLASNGIQTQGLWCIEDVIDKARELNKRCSKKNAGIILSQIQNDFDAEYGITWQTIEQYVEDYFK